ncbi:MAG: hypothetical protein ABSB35_13480 [Bryobacteraceae bacterium]|jgi:predicted short-subunit dehydrogenase-like oxidoreductase (DUF2520 family)
MKPPLVTGLISAGGVHDSFLTRMPRILGRLGPVKAASLRVAARIVNSLRAGVAAEQYSELEQCGLIWIAVPDAALDKIQRELAAGTSFDGTMIVICGSMRSSLSPSPLRFGHARLATLNAIEQSDERAFIGEGDPDVMRELDRMLAEEDRKLITIPPASKALYIAGAHFATHLLLPWIAAAVESMREAGFSRRDATRVVEAMGTHSLRAYIKAGRKAWSPSAAPELQQAAERGLETIRSTNSDLAALYADGIAQALRYFEGEHADLSERASPSTRFEPAPAADRKG